MKKFLTYEEQIQRLRKNKNIIIENEKEAIKILQKYSYYNFINSTKICFALGKCEHGNHIYKELKYYII